MTLFIALLALGQVIDTIAGTGVRGYSGDSGPAAKARLDQPFHCALDGKGSLFIAEAGSHCVRRIDLKTGVISTVAGTGKRGFSGDGGPAIKAMMNEPYAVAITADGDLYITDRLNLRIRKVDSKSGRISTVAGNGKRGDGKTGVATKTPMVEPNDCCLDGKGGLLIADVGAWRIRRLDLKTGLLSTFAGTGRKKGRVARADKGDGGPATKALIHGARAVCVDGKGNTYVCEREGHSLRRIDREGIIATVAGDGTAGNADGLHARFRGPKAVRCDDAGRVFVVDTENHSVRVYDPRTGKVSTLAGGRKGKGGDGDAAIKAGMARPHGCAIDHDGTLYIADSDNDRVRRVKQSTGEPKR